MGKPATSCDNCRRSRLGCNASSVPQLPCSNCTRKGVQCNVRSMTAASRDQLRTLAAEQPRTASAANSRNYEREQPLHPVLDVFNDIATTADSSPFLARHISNRAPNTSSLSSCDCLASSQQSVALHRLLWNVFATLLEPRIGLWMGGHGCPFVTSNSASTTLISRLVVQLDSSLRDRCEPHSRIFSASSDRTVIRRALLHAVYAYSVRWLYLSHDKSQDEEMHRQTTLWKEELFVNLWTQARSHMYAVLSRPSYQSLLALYLFAIIPTSAHMEGDTFPEQCLEASLSHQNYLTSMDTPSFSHRDALIRLLNPLSCPAVDQEPLNSDSSSASERRETMSLASVAYWFSIISDTTRSLTRCRPSIVLPGGSGETKVWVPVRQRAHEFQQRYSSLTMDRWRTPFSDEQVLTVLQYAFAMKTSVWAAITRVQDAVVHRLSGISLADAVDAARKESNLFEEVFGQLLCMSQRDFLFLNRNTQMCYTLLQIHFQVGSLILADILPSTFVFIDENFNPYDLRLCAVRSIINSVNLALQTSSVGSDGSTMVNILALDPYPEILTNAIVRTGSSLFLLYDAQKLTAENVMAMFPVVISGLKVLANLSHTASEAIPLLVQKLATSGIEQLSFLHNDVLHHAELSLAASLKPDTFGTQPLRDTEHDAAALTRGLNTEGDLYASSGVDSGSNHLDQFNIDFDVQQMDYDSCFARFDV